MTNTRTVKATALKPEMNLVYLSSELLTASKTAQFQRELPLSGMIESIKNEGRTLLISLSMGRSLRVEKESDRKVEEDDRERYMVAGRGRTLKYKGISLE